MKIQNVPWSRIERRLVELKKTQQWLRNELQVDANVITNWKKRGIPSAKVSLVAKKLGLSTDDLIDLEVLPDSPQEIDDAPLDDHARRAEDRDDATVVISNASASMGMGIPMLDQEQSVAMMRVSKAWIYGTLPKITGVDHLAILPAYGDSMSPTFSDGDLLLVDRGVRTIELDAVYVISRNNELFVKRVRRRFQDGAVIVKSDNPLFGPDDVIENGERERLEVLGRVVWAWNGRKL